MSKINNGGAAFPIPPESMFLRDWFAGMALQGLIPIIGIPEDGPDDLWDGSTAKRAYALADAMLKAREVQS